MEKPSEALPSQVFQVVVIKGQRAGKGHTRPQRAQCPSVEAEWEHCKQRAKHQQKFCCFSCSLEKISTLYGPSLLLMYYKQQRAPQGVNVLERRLGHNHVSSKCSPRAGQCLLEETESLCFSSRAFFTSITAR